MALAMIDYISKPWNIISLIADFTMLSALMEMLSI